MGTGIPRALRALALVGLLLAFTNFLLGVADWMYPVAAGQGWAGKRVSQFLARPGTPNAKPLTHGQLSSFARWELTALFNHVREPSLWFCAVGVLYLFANQQLRVAKRIAQTTDE